MCPKLILCFPSCLSGFQILCPFSSVVFQGQWNSIALKVLSRRFRSLFEALLQLPECSRDHIGGYASAPAVIISFVRKPIAYVHSNVCLTALVLLQWLAKKLVGDPNLHFVEQVALAPPEVQIDLQQQQEYEKQLQEAAAMPLPDDNDEDLVE